MLQEVGYIAAYLVRSQTQIVCNPVLALPEMLEPLLASSSHPEFVTPAMIGE